MRFQMLFWACSMLVLLASDAIATEQLFRRLDRDNSGTLAVDEIRYEHRRLFDRLLRISDSDKDGELSSTEFQAGLAPTQAEKPLPKKVGNELPGANALLLLLAKMDTNADGKIEFNEVPAQFRDLFERIEDRLGGEPDGVLDRRELTQAGPRLSRIALAMAQRMGLDVDVELALLPAKQWTAVQNMMGPRRRGELLADPQRARELFKQLDANDDGQISLTEVPDALVERFEQLMERADRDGNEQISETELMAVSRQLQAREATRPSPVELQQGIARMVKRFDRNGDGALSPQELPRRMANRFQRMDADGDGQLDRDELVPVVELLNRLRPPNAKTRRGSETNRSAK